MHGVECQSADKQMSHRCQTLVTCRGPQVAATRLTVQTSFTSSVLTLPACLHGLWFHSLILFSAAVLGWILQRRDRTSPPRLLKGRPRLRMRPGESERERRRETERERERERESDGMTLKWERLATWKVREKCYGKKKKKKKKKNSRGAAG